VVLTLLALLLASHPPPEPSVDTQGATIATSTATLAAPVEAARLPSSAGGNDGVQQELLVMPLALIGADVWQAAGFTGHHVRLAVLDTGFAGYEAALGETLPDTLVARSFRFDRDIEAGTDHGLRAAEVAYAVAPGVQLYLVNFTSLADLSEAVDFLIEEQIDVISFSVGFIHNGAGDGTGEVNSIVSRAANAGIAWAVAAGNWAEQHWGGFFRDLDGDFVHEFPLGQSVSHEFDAGDLVIASLRWDDEFGASCSDYDIELFGPNGALIAASRDIQNCDGDPVEGLRVLATQTGAYALRVIRARDDQVRRISLMLIGSPDRGTAIDQPLAPGSLSQPADNLHVITVGAIGPGGQGEAMFSSRGPTLDARTKPNLLAPTARESDAAGFAGTSAAAPHVAGALALLQEAFPSASRVGLTNELFRRSLALSAAPGQTPGVRSVFLSSTDNLGPVLPEGADRATILGLPQDAGVAVGFYQGPDGYPMRFLHLLADGRDATSVFRVLLQERALERYIPGAPDFVNEFDAINSGDLLFLRFDE
jgi:subtilisin family serine protease